MPAAQTPPQHDPFRLDRFRPSVNRVQTPNYDQRTGELRDDFLRRLAQSTFLTIKYGLIDAEGELDRISTLDTDWDTYGADAPDTHAIEASRNILKDLAEALILPTAIVPSAEGGVSIYFMSGERNAYIESDNQGSQALVLYDQQGNVEVLEIGCDIARAQVSERISAFLL